MKTNQLMHVEIGEFRLPIDHLTMMGSLTDLWTYGNSLRIAKGIHSLDMKNYLRQLETLEFVKSLELSLIGEGLKQVIPSDSKSVVTTHYEIVATEHIGRFEIKGPALTCLKTKKGKGGGTWAHLYLLLDAASRLDSDFRLQIYKTFVEGKILQWRNDSGDEFINLNIAIDYFLPTEDKKERVERYKICAWDLKCKIKPDGNTWNTASYLQLQKRAEIEKDLVKYLRMGFVRNFNHLKEIISQL